MAVLVFFLRGGKSSSHPSQKGAHLALLFFWPLRVVLPRGRSASLGAPASRPSSRRCGSPDTLCAGPGARNGAQADTSIARTRGERRVLTLCRPIGHFGGQSVRESVFSVRSAAVAVRKGAVRLVRSPKCSNGSRPLLAGLFSPRRGGSCPARGVSPGNGSREIPEPRRADRSGPCQTGFRERLCRPFGAWRGERVWFPGLTPRAGQLPPLQGEDDRAPKPQGSSPGSAGVAVEV